MKWVEILRNGNYALLQSESDTQYVVASGYDDKAKEDSQWDHGVRRHIVGGTYRTLISVQNPLRLCRTGICRSLSAG